MFSTRWAAPSNYVGAVAGVRHVKKGGEDSLRRDVQFFPSSCQASSKRAKIAGMSRSLTCRQQCQVMPAMCFTQGCAILGIFPELDHTHKNNSLPSQT